MDQLTPRDWLDDELDDALHQMDMEAPPPALLRNVMASVRSTPQMPVFHFSWVEILVAGFLFCMTGVTSVLFAAIPETSLYMLRLNLEHELKVLTMGTPWQTITVMLLSAAVILTLGGIAIYRQYLLSARNN